MTATLRNGKMSTSGDMRDRERVELSVILPAFNEEAAIALVLQELDVSLSSDSASWEILVVDDASTDGTAAVAERLGVGLIRRPQNGGYGAALKSGLRVARGEIIVIMDADGTYSARDIPQLLAHFPEFDQVNGVRDCEQGEWQALRVPVKWTIRLLAEWISGKRIPDLNTGMKAFKKKEMQRYSWALPDGFSCATSMTLAFLCNDHAVKFVPISYGERIGYSKFRPLRDTARYVFTILRMMTYFRPLRVFGPMAALMATVAVVKGIYNWRTYPSGLHDADVILAVGALVVFAIGLLADLIVAQGNAGK